MSGLEALRALLAEDVSRFNDESNKHKALYRQCETTVIVLTALSTIVAGTGLVLPESSGKVVQFAVLCLTSSTSAVAAWAAMRRARELWQHEREVYYALMDIQRQMEFKAANGGLLPEDLQAIFDRAAAVLGSSSQKWARIQDRKEGLVGMPTVRPDGG